MFNREKVIEAFDEAKELVWTDDDEYTVGYNNGLEAGKDIAFAMLKEQEAMNVDAFIQWCIDSHIMGDATVMGIKYWVGKYKETKGGR